MRVYLIENKINGKRYVGITINTIHERFISHRSAVKSGSGLYLHNAIRKYGEESFDISVLEECLDIETLKEREISWIETLGTFGGGYNLTKGGDGLWGHIHSEETRRKMSESRKGEKNHNFGKQWGYDWSDATPEELAARNKKISETLTGFKQTAEAKQKISASQYKKVIQYDMNGAEVARYNSMIEAETKTGIGRTGISRCCRETHRTARGFKFRFQDELKAQ